MVLLFQEKMLKDCMKESWCLPKQRYSSSFKVFKKVNLILIGFSILLF